VIQNNILTEYRREFIYVSFASRHFLATAFKTHGTLTIDRYSLRLRLALLSTWRTHAHSPDCDRMEGDLLFPVPTVWQNKFSSSSKEYIDPRFYPWRRMCCYCSQSETVRSRL